MWLKICLKGRFGFHFKVWRAKLFQTTFIRDLKFVHFMCAHVNKSIASAEYQLFFNFMFSSWTSLVWIRCMKACLKWLGRSSMWKALMVSQVLLPAIWTLASLGPPQGIRCSELLKELWMEDCPSLTGKCMQQLAFCTGRTLLSVECFLFLPKSNWLVLVWKEYVSDKLCWKRF